MSSDDNKAVVRRLFDAENRGELDVIDELVASDCQVHPVWHKPVMPAHLPPETSPAPERWKAMGAWQRELFPDRQVAIEEMLTDGDRVIVRWTDHGTFRQGQAVSSQGINIYRIAGGKIVELWFLWDRLGYWQQLGLVPPTEKLLEQAGM